MPARSIAPILFALALSGCGRQSDAVDKAALADQQAQVVERGRSIMPFDIDRSMHHFQKAPSGGVQEVLSTDGDPRQIALIRQHLRGEGALFEQGDFSDPSSIHGAEMPGLRALAAGANRIRIRYEDVPRGGQITYTTDDSRLVAAIHSWFDAQVRDHGRHAMPM